MSDKQLPRLGEEKTLYVTTTEGAGSALYYEKVRTVLKNNPCLRIISYEDLMLLKENNSLILPPDVIVKIGSVWVHNPYAEPPHTFIVADNADFEIRKFKIFKILEIANLLGVSSYKISVNEKESYKRKLNNDFTVRYSVDLNTNSGIEEEFIQLIETNSSGSFQGNPIVSLDAYEQALSIAKTTGLNNDPAINTLFLSRHPNCGNPCREYKYSYNLTQEINTYFDAAFSLDATGVFTVNANLRNILATKTNREIKFKFIFPQNN